MKNKEADLTDKSGVSHVATERDQVHWHRVSRSSEESGDRVPTVTWHIMDYACKTQKPAVNNIKLLVATLYIIASNQNACHSGTG